MINILIIGSTGNIGQILVNYLKSKSNINIILINNIKHNYKYNVNILNDNIKIAKLLYDYKIHFLIDLTRITPIQSIMAKIMIKNMPLYCTYICFGTYGMLDNCEFDTIKDKLYIKSKYILKSILRNNDIIIILPYMVNDINNNYEINAIINKYKIKNRIYIQNYIILCDLLYNIICLNEQYKNINEIIIPAKTIYIK